MSSILGKLHVGSLHWEALHPMMVHLPLGALVVVPLLVILALGSRRHRTTYTLASTTVLAIGTFGLYLSAVTGNAALDLALQRFPAVREAIEAHQGWAQMSVVLFSLLTLLLAALLLVPLLFEDKHRSRSLPPLYAVFLLLYVASLVPLALAGYTGGQLVHRHGILAVPAAGWPDTPLGATLHEMESSEQGDDAE